MKLGFPWCSEGHPRTQMRLESEGEACIWLWRCPECWATADVIEEPALEDTAMVADEVFVRVAGIVVEKHREWSGPVMYRFRDGEWPEVGLEVREVGCTAVRKWAR